MTDTTDTTQSERCAYAVWNRQWQRFECTYRRDCIDKDYCEHKVPADKDVFECLKITINSRVELDNMEFACQKAEMETIARKAEMDARRGF